MTADRTLAPAKELAAGNRAHFPNESSEYREARNALLAEEIELRRHIERVARQRRALPAGGPVTGDYFFQGEEGPVRFSDLFAGKPTLVAYSWMFGPERERPCPMCTNLLDTWAGTARDVEQRVALVVIARSPIERLAAFRNERGWRHLRLFSDVSGDFTRDYVDPKDGDTPALNVFTRRDDTIRHFWSAEIGFEMSDPGQDPRGAPDPSPLWAILDSTPEGRAADWYPKLDYPA